MSAQSWFRRRPRYSLRALLALLVLANIAWAAWFHWAWPVVSAGDLTEKTTDRECLEAALALLQFPVDNVPPSHNHTILSGGHGGFLPIWAKEIANVRYHAEYGRERHGLTETYYSDGGVCGSEHWEAGEMHGEFRAFYRNGKRLVSGRFQRGRPDGIWTVWRPNGEEFAEAEFRGGRPFGNWKQRQRPGDFPAGHSLSDKARDVFWRFDQIGQYAEFDERYPMSGVATIVFDNVGGYGRGKQVYDEQGRLRFEAQWDKDGPAGRWASYDPDGKRVINAEYDAGVLQTVNNVSPDYVPTDRFYSPVITPISAEPRTQLQLIESVVTKTPLYVRAAAAESPALSETVSFAWEGDRGDALRIFLTAAGLSIVERVPGYYFLEPKDQTPPLVDEAEVQWLREQRQLDNAATLARCPIQGEVRIMPALDRLPR